MTQQTTWLFRRLELNGISVVSLAGAATSMIFDATKHVFCRDKSMFVATKVCLSRQKYACRDKSMLVATKVCLSRQKYACRDKSMFVATKVCLSRQKYACRDKNMLVATKVCLSRQKYACRDKHVFVSVATKIILVAAVANHNLVFQSARLLVTSLLRR